MFNEEEERQRVPALVSTTSAYVADTCTASLPTELNSQLCVLSSGLDIEGVAAQLILARHGGASDVLSLVVLPDGIDVGTTTKIASTLEAQLALTVPNPTNGAATPRDGACRRLPHVHAMEEGTGVKERCLAYQQGGVVVVASRMLCADILHKRLSLAVVALALVLIPYQITRHGSTARRSDAVTPSLAFSVELCLRSAGGAVVRRTAPLHTPQSTLDGSNNGPAAPPRRAVILLSDNPALMQYLVQRHQVGSERFLQQMRIGDIQLFPRFRLNLVQHFEKLSNEKPLRVDRIVVNVATSVMILDHLLQKILREVLSELQSVDARLGGGTEGPAGTVDRHGVTGENTADRDTSSGTGGSSFRRHLQRDTDADDGIPRSFQPRSRLQRDAVNGKLDYSSFAKTSAAGRTSVPGAAKTESYIRRPWRASGPASAHRILFSAVSDDVLMDMASNDLDADVSAAIDVHDINWPFRALAESLIDVRWLRRALWSGTCYDFVFALERCLQRRQRRSERQAGAPAPPAALWTLSSHFHDLVTVATHRIGDVVLVDDETTAGAHATPTGPAEPVLVVDDEDEDDSHDGSDAEESEVAIVGTRKPPTYRIVASSEEQDYAVEVAVRLAKSWCRDVMRRRTRATRATAATSGEPAQPSPSPPAPPPALLLVVESGSGMVRLMERLLYRIDTVRQMELNAFLRRYQQHHGVYTTESSSTAASVNPLPDTVSRHALGTQSPQQPRTAAFQPNANSGNTRGAASMPDAGTDAEDVLLTQWLQLKGNPSHHLANSSSSDEDDESAEDKEPPVASSRPDRAIGTTPGSARAALQAEIGSALFGNQKPTVQKSAAAGRTSSAPVPPASLHQLLLTQAPQPPPSAPPASAVGSGDAVSSFSLERIQHGVAVLVPQVAGDSTKGDAEETALLPRVVVVSEAYLSVADLMAFFTGRHRCLRSAFFDAEGGEGETDESGAIPADTTPTAPPGTSVATRVVVVHHSLTVLRQLEMCQDALPSAVVASLRVQLVTSTFTDAAVKTALDRERHSFASLAHVKATLTGTLLMDHAALRDTEAMLENGILFGNKRRRTSKPYVTLAGSHVRPEARVVQPPLIVFDEREFRSSLPYSIYARGIDLIPLTLTTADYILSLDYAVERKSVRDFTQSLTSGRIYHQLAALSRKYAHPLCLIEFSRNAPFRLVYASVCTTSAERSTMSLMYARIARVVTSYPRVAWIWSRSPAHSAAMFAELKRTVAVENVDPSDSTLTGGAANWAEAGGSAAPGEASSYAARILSRFPGVTPQNAPKVMRLCGSLAGLATVSRESLLDAIGEQDGEVLYSFLHTPYAETA